MNLNVRWVSATSTVQRTWGVAGANLQPWPTQPGTRRFFNTPPAVYEDPGDAPDLLVLARGTGGALLLRNGLMRKEDRAAQRGTLRGSVRIDIDGKLLHLQHDLVIEDGTSWALSFQDASQPDPDLVWCSWLMRDSLALWSQSALDPKGALCKSLTAYFLGLDPHYKGQADYDEPEPDMPGSPRICPSGWAGAYGAAYLRLLGKPVPPIYRQAADDWTVLQARKPIGYYDEQGEPYRFSAESDSWVDEHGCTDVGHGSFKRISLAEYDADDDEHLELKRLHAAAALWGNPLAVLLLDHWGEALCSRPDNRFVKPSTNARASGRSIESLALCASVLSPRPQLGAAIHTRYLGVVESLGSWVPGHPFACAAPEKLIDDKPDVVQDYSHVYATDDDARAYCTEKSLPWPGDNVTPKELAAFLTKCATSAGLKPDAFTTGPDGLWERFRAVLPAWLGALGAGLWTAARVPVAAENMPNVLATMRHLADCVLLPGTKLSTDENGESIIGKPCHDSYAKGAPGRAMAAHIEFGGTMSWLAQFLGALVQGGTPQQQHDARLVLVVLKASAEEAKLPHLQAVQDYWPALGMLG